MKNLLVAIAALCACSFPVRAQHPAAASNMALVEDRGYIYVVDRANTGMHILEMAK